MKLPPIDGLESLPTASLQALLDVFEREGFGEATIDLADSIAASAPGAVRLSIVRNDLLRRSEPAFHLAVLFHYRGTLSRAKAEDHVGAELVQALLAAGLLIREGETGVACPFRILPTSGAWILADTILEHPDSVMPPGPSTATLARLVPATVRGSMLDVGCGPGSLALLAAARGATRVLGVDINPRAIAMARFNARWNGLDVEFRCGDLFAPAGGERFDLVVSQPPFAALPENLGAVTFLHGGARGDAIVLRLLAGLESALTADGEALVLCDVALAKNESMADYLRDRMLDADLHVLALHVAGLDAETHALLYTQLGSIEASPGYVREVLEHRAHLATLGIEAFHHVVFLARRPGPARREAWRTAMSVRDLGCVVPAVRARLWAAIRSAGESDPLLLRRRIRVAPDAQWISLRRAPEGEQSEHRVRFGPGWPALEQIVTDEGVVLASLLESSARVEDAIAGYAERCDATPEEVRKPLLDYIRKSLLSGMLAPEENGHGH